jgi:hypothetical protein
MRRMENGMTMPEIDDYEENLGELARMRALAGVERALWELATNILDVAQGEGKPLLLAPQAQALVDTINAHRSITGSAPSTNELANVLDITSIPVVMTALHLASRSLAQYHSQLPPEAEIPIPTGYNTGYRPETQTTDF